jgi:hypothetical protein
MGKEGWSSGMKRIAGDGFGSTSRSATPRLAANTATPAERSARGPRRKSAPIRPCPLVHTGGDVIAQCSRPFNWKLIKSISLTYRAPAPSCSMLYSLAPAGSGEWSRPMAKDDDIDHPPTGLTLAASDLADFLRSKHT